MAKRTTHLIRLDDPANTCCGRPVGGNIEGEHDPNLVTCRRCQLQFLPNPMRREKRPSPVLAERARCVKLVREVLAHCDCPPGKFCESFGCKTLREIIEKMEKG